MVNILIGTSLVIFSVVMIRLIVRVSRQLAEWDALQECGCDSRDEMIDITEHDD